MDKATPNPKTELTDALRIPMDELEADAGYLMGRAAADPSCADAMAESVRVKIRAIRAEVERLAAQAAPTEPKHPLLNITAKQLRAALDFANPDPDDPDQLEAKVCIQWGEARDDGDGGTEPAGLRAWLAECPEEGSISLDLWGTEGGLV